MMKVGIRLDASSQIGVGHLMRCLTLADALSERGAAIYFITKELVAEWESLILARQYQHLKISYADEALNALDIVEWEEDAQATLNCLKPLGILDWLIVDHYGLDARWQELVRTTTRKIFVIDDLANRPHYCDVLLDQNFHENAAARYMGLTPKHCVHLLGPSYALLRREFLHARDLMAVPDTENFRVLLAFGGSDPTGETLKVLEAIETADIKDIKFDVVVGAANPARAKIEDLCRNLPVTNYLFNVPDMALLMKRADLFVGAAGSTTWERSCLGLPGVVVATADNQVAGALALGRHGMHVYLGNASSVSGSVLMDAIRTLRSVPSLRESLRRNSLGLVDGRGVDRIMRAICTPNISLRTAVASDCEALFSWRNNPDVRRYSFDQEPLDWDTHSDWFFATLKNPRRVLLIGAIGGNPLGVLRYDLQGGSATVSIYLATGCIGGGYGRSLLEAGNQWMVTEHPEILELTADIVPENQASVSVFEKAGFKLKHFILGRLQEHVH